MTVTETGTRAREPDEHGYATTDDGLRLYWERHGSGSPTIVLLPPCPISHSRIWKAQLHYLARHHRVVVYDGRGNGHSDRPDLSGPWLDRWRASDCLAVMDATSTETAVLAGICGDGVWPSIAARRRASGARARDRRARPGRPVARRRRIPGGPPRSRASTRSSTSRQGWEKQNRHYMRADYRGFLEFFFGEMFPEPHSTKQIEDAVAYGLDGPVEAQLMDDADPVASTQEEVEEMCRRVRCPVLVVQGDRDNCQPSERGLAFAELTGAEHVQLAGAGHIPNARHPVLVNRLIRRVRRAARAGRAAAPHLAARRRAAAAGAARLVADRPRSRLARRRDRARAAAAASRASRSTGSPSHR